MKGHFKVREDELVGGYIKRRGGGAKRRFRTLKQLIITFITCHIFINCWQRSLSVRKYPLSRTIFLKYMKHEIK
jgi:hypothetical protein